MLADAQKKALLVYCTVLLKSHLLRKKKIRFNKVLDKKRSTRLARVVKVKIGCVTGTSLLWYLKCSVGPTNPILMTFTFYVLNLKIELSHGKRIVIEVSNFFKLSTHVRRSLIETISNEFVHGQP